MYLLKFAHQASQKLPGVSITEFYSDLCLPSKESQRFYNMVSREDGVKFLHMQMPDSIEIVQEDGQIRIKYMDVSGAPKEVTSDMVVLAQAIEGARDARDVAEVFDISRDESGFFVEEHPALTPVSTAKEGIFIAGCAQGPKDIPGSVAQGQAAAGRILSSLVPGEKLTLEPVIAEIDEALCSGCKVCIGLCLYKAIDYDDTGKQLTVNGILCRGCGLCAAACPSAAIKANHFTDTQISSEISGLAKPS